MAQIIQTREELFKVVDIIQRVPYEVFCMQDINTLAFPIVAKWVLIDPGDVYLVPFDVSDLLDFYELMAEKLTAAGVERPGIEGYDYAEAESTKAIEGTSPAIEATISTVSGQDVDVEIRPA